MLVSRRFSARYMTRSYEAGDYPPHNHLEVFMNGCTSHMDLCETKGTSQAEDRSGGGYGKRFFQALALFSQLCVNDHIIS